MHTKETCRAIAVEAARMVEDRTTPEERACFLRGDDSADDYVDVGGIMHLAFREIVGRDAMSLAEAEELGADAMETYGDDMDALGDAETIMLTAVL